MPFPDLADRVREVRQRIQEAAGRGGHGQPVQIVAVTKNHGPDAIAAAAEVGIADVGENRVQEAFSKMAATTASVRWHLIGHLQRNKVKTLAQFDFFDALDSLRLARAVSEFALGTGARIRSLVQVNVLGEASKGGFSLDELPALGDELGGMEGIDVHGVMTMAPFDASELMLRTVFRGARRAREILQSAGHLATELSMGMSNDYEVAVEEGATSVRLGSVLFGARSS